MKGGIYEQESFPDQDVSAIAALHEEGRPCVASVDLDLPPVPRFADDLDLLSRYELVPDRDVPVGASMLQ